MKIAFLYNLAAEDPAHFCEDDHPERSPVVASLQRLGHEVAAIPVTLDLASVRRHIEHINPEVAFNRVESLGGSDAMAASVAMLLDSMGVPYTGCHTESLVAATSKVSVKKRLLSARLPTPEWIDGDFGLSGAEYGVPGSDLNRSRFILKSIYEHASFDLDDASVVGPVDHSEIAELLLKRTAMTGKPFFAERFVEGREFNLSLLAPEPVVLPPAEIDFSAFPKDKPRIVGFGAKWAHGSFEFENTPRRFDLPPADAPLLRELTELAIRCWTLFELRGYARVDFRIDQTGQPWILEINTNPCIAPTSGFAAALEQAGMSYDQGIQRIVEAALPLTESDSTQRTSQVPLSAKMNNG